MLYTVKNCKQNEDGSWGPSLERVLDSYLTLYHLTRLGFNDHDVINAISNLNKGSNSNSVAVISVKGSVPAKVEISLYKNK